jgi:hypothetical protein
MGQKQKVSRLFGAMSKRRSIPFARSPSGIPGRDPGVGGGMPHGRPHGEDYGAQMEYARERL